MHEDKRRKYLFAGEVDELTLADQLSAELGFRVAVSADPGAQVFVVSDDATGEALDVNEAVIERALSAHVPPVRQTPAERLVAALEGVDTIAGLRTALQEYAGTLAAEDRRVRERRRPLRG